MTQLDEFDGDSGRCRREKGAAVLAAGRVEELKPPRVPMSPEVATLFCLLMSQMDRMRERRRESDEILDGPH